MRPLQARLEKLEAALGVRGDVVMVEHDGDIGFKVAYHFDQDGAVLGIRIGSLTYARLRGEPLHKLRERAFAAGVDMKPIWMEILRQVSGKSRGLLGERSGGQIEKWRREEALRRERLDAGTKRRRGETDIGERVIGFMELLADRR